MLSWQPQGLGYLCPLRNFRPWSSTGGFTSAGDGIPLKPRWDPIEAWGDSGVDRAPSVSPCALPLTLQGPHWLGWDICQKSASSNSWRKLLVTTNQPTAAADLEQWGLVLSGHQEHCPLYQTLLQCRISRSCSPWAAPAPPAPCQHTQTFPALWEVILMTAKSLTGEFLALVLHSRVSSALRCDETPALIHITIYSGFSSAGK